MTDSLPTVRAAMKRRIELTQARCGTRLAQIEPVIESSTFGPVRDVDISFLLDDALTEAHAREGWAVLLEKPVQLCRCGVGVQTSLVSGVVQLVARPLAEVAPE